MYNEYRNTLDKSSFFKKISSFEEKKSLWYKLSAAEKKGLLSRLKIDDIKSFLSNMDIVDRMNVYEFFDENKLRGYYNSLDEDGKKKMISEINDKNAKQQWKKQLLKNNLIKNYNEIDGIDKELEKISNRINKSLIEIEKMNLAAKKIGVKIIPLNRLEKKHIMEQLKKRKPSILDKVGLFKKIKDKIGIKLGVVPTIDNIKDEITKLEDSRREIIKRTDKLKSQLERDLEQIGKLNQFKSNMSANVNRLNQGLDKVLASSKYLDSIGNSINLLSNENEHDKEKGGFSKQKNIDFSKLSDEELNKMADKFNKMSPIPKYYVGVKEAINDEFAKRREAKYSQMTLEELQEEVNRLEKNNKKTFLYIKDRENYRALLLALIAKKASSIVALPVNDIEEKVNKVQNKVADLEQAGVYFENNDPIGKEFVVNGKPIDKLSDREMIILAEIINNKLRERGKSISIDQEKGVSRTLSKGNVSFGLLVGIVILLLTLLFMIF